MSDRFLVEGAPTGINIVLVDEESSKFRRLVAQSICCNAVMSYGVVGFWHCHACGLKPIMNPLHYSETLSRELYLSDVNTTQVTFWIHRWTGYEMDRIVVELA